MHTRDRALKTAKLRLRVGYISANKKRKLPVYNLQFSINEKIRAMRYSNTITCKRRGGGDEDRKGGGENCNSTDASADM